MGVVCWDVGFLYTENLFLARGYLDEDTIIASFVYRARNRNGWHKVYPDCPECFQE